MYMQNGTYWEVSGEEGDIVKANSSEWGISSGVGKRWLSLRGLVHLVPLDTMTLLGSFYSFSFLHDKISFYCFFIFTLKAGAVGLQNLSFYLHPSLIWEGNCQPKLTILYISCKFHFLKCKLEDFEVNSSCLL